MSGMERLTQRAKRVLSLAHQEAERLRHDHIGTEHLLLGLIIEDGGVASRVLRELGLEPYMDRININGGAIALGHPLGCTGAKLCATLLANMQARGAQYGVESMCIGGGMGMAALFELSD